MAAAPRQAGTGGGGVWEVVRGLSGRLYRAGSAAL